MQKSKVQTKTQKLEKELEETKTKYLRALADYQNLEKRIQEEKEYITKSAKKNFIMKLLPFLDNLEKAEVFFKDEGLKMIKNQLTASFEDEGLEELSIDGQEFDPHLAEAVEIVSGEKDNIIIETVRRGYKFGDQVIRPAQVKVSKQI